MGNQGNKCSKTRDIQVLVERVTRIELALSAWEADVLPLNYTRERRKPPAREPEATCPVIVPDGDRTRGLPEVAAPDAPSS